MDRVSNFLKALDSAERDVLWWEQNTGSRFEHRIKRLARYKFNYLLYFFSKFAPFKIKARTILGDSIYCSLPNYYYFLLFGFFISRSEVKLSKFFIKNLTDNSVFFDVGANCGFYTLLAHRRIKSGEIHSFEPTPSIFGLLKRSTKNFKHITINQAAVGDRAQTVSFFTSPQASWENSLTKTNVKAGNVTEIAVSMTTLDEYCKEKNIVPSFIKIDVEGAEYKAIQGARGILSKYSPTLSLEMLQDNFSSFRKAFLLLTDLAYKPFSINEEGDLIPIDNLDIFLKGEWEQEESFENLIFKK